MPKSPEITAACVPTAGFALSFFHFSDAGREESMIFLRRYFLYLAICLAVLPTISCRANAETYPSRPIVMIVPYAAGGTFDVLGRILASRMSELLGQPVIVENTSGAG